jgi:hypothetical protein
MTASHRTVGRDVLSGKGAAAAIFRAFGRCFSAPAAARGASHQCHCRREIAPGMTIAIWAAATYGIVATSVHIGSILIAMKRCRRPVGFAFARARKPRWTC